MTGVLRGAALPILAVVLLQAGFMWSGIRSDSLAPPSSIALAFRDILLSGELFSLMSETMTSVFGGLAVGGIVGIICGAALGLSPLASRITFPTIEALRPIPSVALIPLALLIFGFGFKFEIAIVSYSSFWPILILTQSATRQIEVRQLEVARLLGMGFWRTFKGIILPSALPRLIVAVRLAAGVALVVAITVEIVVNPQGVGYALMRSQERLRPDLMYAMLLSVGLLGWGFNRILVSFERWASPPP